ncbi:hypothetical protein [Herminiimonas sp. CN]|uniref:hypothetical protein n=1 Tax=Herminiimonas sp. CN TaxID=1349818 RepID=UPI000474288D|nr:hypothetical protein [Herminiimonas sp. CN]
MTPEEFSEVLDKLNWKQIDFCRMTDIRKTTTSRWMNGVTPIPGWAVRFLAMAQEIKRLSKLIEPQK